MKLSLNWSSTLRCASGALLQVEDLAPHDATGIRTPNHEKYRRRALAVLFGAWFIIQIRSTLVFGILFAAAIEPLVNRLRRHGLGRGQSILAIYLVLLSLFGLLIVAVAPPLVNQGSQLIDDVPTLLADLRVEAVNSDSAFVRDGGTRAIDQALAAYYRARAEPPIEGQQARGLHRWRDICHRHRVRGRFLLDDREGNYQTALPGTLLN